jgi:hypothetical protein
MGSGTGGGQSTLRLNSCGKIYIFKKAYNVIRTSVTTIRRGRFKE